MESPGCSSPEQESVPPSPSGSQLSSERGRASSPIKDLSPEGALMESPGHSSPEQESVLPSPSGSQLFSETIPVPKPKPTPLSSEDTLKGTRSYKHLEEMSTKPKPPTHVHLGGGGKEETKGKGKGNDKGKGKGNGNGKGKGKGKGNGKGKKGSENILKGEPGSSVSFPIKIDMFTGDLSSSMHSTFT
jgi:hypothetical protein